MQTKIKFTKPNPDEDGVLVIEMISEDGSLSSHRIHNPQVRAGLEDKGRIGMWLEPQTPRKKAPGAPPEPADR